MKQIWQPGALIWAAGDEEVPPVVINRGAVTYVVGADPMRGLGILGPGQTALPVPGVLGGGKALLGLMAITEAETEVTPIVGAATESVAALVAGAERALTQDLPQRLAGTLLLLTELLGSDSVAARQEVLASVLGVRRETLATVLSGWNNSEWIRTRYRRVTVKDRDALIAIAGGTLP